MTLKVIYHWLQGKRHLVREGVPISFSTTLGDVFIFEHPEIPGEIVVLLPQPAQFNLFRIESKPSERADVIVTSNTITFARKSFSKVRCQLSDGDFAIE